MKVTFLGHSVVLIENRNFKAIIDNSITSNDNFGFIFIFEI